MGVEIEAKKGNPRVYISNAPHKRKSIEVGLAEYGVEVLFADSPQFAEEPDLFSPMAAPLKTKKFLSHPEVSKQIDGLEIEGAFWAFTMDVNGVIPGRKTAGLGPELLTTCRGRIPSVDKVAMTAETIYERKKWERGQIVFDNNCSPLQIERGEILQWTGFTERAKLSLSIPLMKLMIDSRIWRKVISASNEHPKTRPLDNPGATAGLDWSILSDYLGVISMTSGVRGLELVWENSRGRKWRANENGVQKGMVKDMTTHLRGFRESTIAGIANLPN